VRNVCVRERDKCFISAKQLYTRGVASKLPKIITDGPRKGRGIYTRSIRAARIYPRFTLGRPSFLFSDAWIYARTPRAHSPSRKEVTDLSLSLSLSRRELELFKTFLRAEIRIREKMSNPSHPLYAGILPFACRATVPRRAIPSDLKLPVTRRSAKCPRKLFHFAFIPLCF